MRNCIMQTGPVESLPQTSAGIYIYMGVDSIAAGGMDICSSQVQSIDFTVCSVDYRGAMICDWKSSPAAK